MLEVVSRVVLLHVAHAVEDRAVGEDGLHAEHGAVEAAVAEEAEAAGVRRDVTALGKLALKFLFT